MHGLGKPYLFANLRALRGPRWSESMRISGYGPPTGHYGNQRVEDMAKAFDAVLFIDHMAPATPLDR